VLDELAVGNATGIPVTRLAPPGPPGHARGIPLPLVGRWLSWESAAQECPRAWSRPRAVLLVRLMVLSSRSGVPLAAGRLLGLIGRG
jgi:hypothetical protein